MLSEPVHGLSGFVVQGRKKPNNLETAVPGFFFAGFHWLNTLQSGNVLGFDKDHKIIVEKLC